MVCRKSSCEGHLYGLQEELLDKVVMPYLHNIDSERSVEVRKRATVLLVDVSMTCTSSSVLDVVQVLRKVALSSVVIV